MGSNPEKPWRGDNVIRQCRTGHATTLLRQRDHVFKPINCCWLHYSYFCRGNLIRHQGLKIFRFFACHWSSNTMTRCHCHDAIKLSHAQLRFFYWIMSLCRFQLCSVRNLPGFGDISAKFGMVWRFLPVADPLVDVMISRDLDSRYGLALPPRGRSPGGCHDLQRPRLQVWFGTSSPWQIPWWMSWSPET